MSTTARLSEIAAMIGDPARANMLIALMGGMALTASELAVGAGITAQTASGHLKKMLDAGLLAVESQGRHRYFRLAGYEVATLLESLMVLAGGEAGAVQGRTPRWRGPAALRNARTCYDHLAGRLGVGLARALERAGHLVETRDAFVLTPSGEAFLAGLGVNLANAEAERRPFARRCLDWSERVPHIGGALGAALAVRLLELGYVRRKRGDRALTVTPAGERAFQERFDLPPDIWRG